MWCRDDHSSFLFYCISCNETLFRVQQKMYYCNFTELITITYSHMHTEIRSASVILKYQLKCCDNIHVKKSTLIFWNGSHSLFPPRIYQVPVFSCGLDTFKIYFSWRRGWLGIQDAKEINLFLDIFSFSIVCWGIWYPFIWNISNYFESIININLVLYRSESSTQAFLILAVWLYRRFKTQ